MAIIVGLPFFTRFYKLKMQPITHQIDGLYTNIWHERYARRPLWEGVKARGGIDETFLATVHLTNRGSSKL
jgi:hypothetical protein